MSVVGNFTIPAGSFALADSFERLPELTVEADRLASHSTMEVLPFLWLSSGDGDIPAALAADSTVEDVTIAEQTDDGLLARIEWSGEFKGFINEMVDHHAAIVEAGASDGEWDLRLRFAEESQVSEFQTHFRETGHQFEVQKLAQPTDPRQREFGLTPEQYETVVAATEAGYFRIPRETSVEELGETLGISANAVSQRLRRGTDALVRNSLSVSDDDDETTVEGTGEGA